MHYIRLLALTTIFLWLSDLQPNWLLGVHAADTVPLATEVYAREIRQWREKHEEKFRSPGGWLALTGHFWLKQGDNQFSSDKSADIQLPAAASGSAAGIIRVQGNSVSLTSALDAHVRINGQEATSASLTIDPIAVEADSPDKIQIGERVTLQLVRRAGRLAVRVRDSQSPLIQEFKRKQWFPVAEKYRVQATYTPLPRPKSVKILNIKGDELTSYFSGAVEFQLDGKTVRLDVILEDEQNLFVIFKDTTNGRTTYGAGRFVDITLPVNYSGQGPVQVELDFNKTYSPPCAWSPHTLCPLPPKQNHLTIAIEAGEMKLDTEKAK